MIGDDINTDIKGVLSVNMKAIFLNINKRKHQLKIGKKFKI